LYIRVVGFQADRLELRLVSLTLLVAVSNPAEGWVFIFAFVVCCVCSSLCDKLVVISEESYQMCVFVSNCVCVWSRNLKTKRSWADVGCFVTEGKEDL